MFFLAVVLFSVFFSLGYMVGFSRGQKDRVTTIASANPPPAEETQSEVRLPDTLLEEAPKPPDTLPAEEPRAVAVAETKPDVAKTEPSPVRREPAPPPPQPKSTPKPAVAPVTNTSGSSVAKTIHLQVSALRVRSDAQVMVDKLKAKGYPVVLHDQAGDGWNRVLVGPFRNIDEAQAMQKRLEADGLKTLLRR